MTESAILVLTYNNYDLTLKFLEHNLPWIKDYQIIIADNGSLITEENLLREFALSNSWKIWELNKETDNFICSNTNGLYNRHILIFKENLGYAKGNNLGMCFIHSFIHCKFILICNNDIFWNINVISNLEQFLKNDPQILAVAPQVKDMNELRNQNPAKFTAEDRFNRAFYDLLYPFSWLFSKLRGSFRENRTMIFDSEEKTLTFINPSKYYLSGCCFMVNYSNFESIGFFDPNTFLGAEEIIVAHKAKNNNLNLAYTDTITVEHYHGSTFKKLFSSKQSHKIFEKSNIYYLQSYCNFPLWKIILIRISGKYFRNIWLPIINFIQRKHNGLY